MKQRVVTGVIIAILFLALLFVGKIWFAMAIAALALVGFYEFSKMHDSKAGRISTIVGFIGVIYFVFPWNSYVEVNQPPFEVSIWLFLFLFLTVTVISKNKVKLEKVAILFIGMIYIGIGCHYMIVTRLMDDGLFWSLFIFACIWITDIGAYFTGGAIGKRLLWPTISPKKTVEGAIGAVILSVVTAILFSISAPHLLALDVAILLGLVISIVGQLGDFIQSAYKRTAGVKDSGTLFPGHGGMLDRCDSWLIVFPFVHLFSLLPLG